MINVEEADAAVKLIAKKFKVVSPHLNERGRRLWAAAEANAIGYGGVAWVARATGIAHSTIGAGKRELRDGGAEIGRIRRRGAGRRSLEKKHPGLVEALLLLVADSTRGDPESALTWTLKSTYLLAKELSEQGFPCSS